VSTINADARLAAFAAGQQGVFTRAQAMQAGFGSGRIERRVRAGVWVRVFPRVYRHAATPMSGALLRWAVVSWAGEPCALSHTSAAAIWRLRGARGERPEIIVPRARAPRVAGVVVHRVTRIVVDDVVRVGGLSVTSPARTIIDLAAVLGAVELAALVTDVRARRPVTLREVRTRLDQIGTAGRPGSARLRTLLVSVGSGRVGSSARMAG
jgi:hypothetical protein